MRDRLGLIDRLDVVRGWKAPAGLVAARQAERLRRLVRHAYENVPYYRRLLDGAGIGPDRIESAEDLRLVPITSRREFQALPIEDRIPRNVEPRSLQTYITSGTTGRPLEIRQTARDAAVNDMLALRIYSYHGMRPWHLKMGLRSRGELPRDRGLLSKLGLFRRAWMSIRTSEDEQVARLRAVKPDFIIGYSTTLGILGRALNARGITDVRPKCVFTTANVLEPKTREDIENGFGCPARDVYASWEGGMMAWECGRCPGYHINTDWVIVEILRGNRPALPGEAGDVVLTSLHSFGMPFIRYRIGDVAVRNTKQPVCGCELPLLGNVFGRTGDLVATPDGRRLSPHAFFTILDVIPGIVRWRMVQQARDRFRVEVIPGEGFGEAASAAVRKGFCDLLEQRVEVEVVPVEKPSWAEDSKFRPIVSEVREDAPAPSA